jgi:hypothetical protein
MTDFHARAAVLRGMALRLEDRAAGLQSEALHLKAIADQCTAEGDRDQKLCPHWGRTHNTGGWNCPTCGASGPADATTRT